MGEHAFIVDDIVRRTDIMDRGYGVLRRRRYIVTRLAREPYVWIRPVTPTRNDKNERSINEKYLVLV